MSPSVKIISLLGETNLSLAIKVVSAEVMMAQFIAMHNLSADHLSGVLNAMFPDSKIAAEFSSRGTLKLKPSYVMLLTHS